MFFRMRICYLLFMLNTLDGLNGSHHQHERSSGYHCTYPTTCSKELFVTNNHQDIKSKDMIWSENEFKNRWLNGIGMGEVILSSCKMGDLNWTLKLNQLRWANRKEHFRWREINKGECSIFNYCIQSELISSHIN